MRWLAGILLGVLCVLALVRRLRAGRDRVEVGPVSDDWLADHKADPFH